MLTHQEVVAGLSDENLSNLAGNIEVGNLGSYMNSQNCAASCAMSPASEEDYHTRYLGYQRRTHAVLRLEHAYCGWYGFQDHPLGAAEMYQLVIQEQALRTGRATRTEALVQTEVLAGV